ncbi:class I SAM-dependent methyltransferase [Rhizobacter sp. Root404]|uniref:class I SAM-dependent methyltransferase n=1 Tax=Rhizobacter sp. Root404 TaxID=1736528 RepID=UPI000701AF30|nr:class I SAM-dependent methyltransferase [Rhizobacter sp. Root404]KQW40668.1 methyltransferase type 11 [Rhizobacter sp. Root404]
MPSPPPPHQAALAQYRRRASVYDAELALFEPVRRQAIAQLVLQAGNTVIDAGCGTGLSLRALRTAVGASGRVIGIEQCPEMLAQARDCVARQGWRNVTLIEASVEDALITSGADAALFHFTHDILRAPAAVSNVMQALRPGARVVACGLKWAAPWAWPVNLFVFGAALHSVTSLDGLAEPWSLLRAPVAGLVVESAMAGAVFIARGHRR